MSVNEALETLEKITPFTQKDKVEVIEKYKSDTSYLLNKLINYYNGENVIGNIDREIERYKERWG